MPDSWTKEKPLRYWMMVICSFASLAGCVNYVGMTSHSRQWHPACVPYRVTSGPGCRGWWNRFHDARLNNYVNIALRDSPSIQIARNRLTRAQQLSQAAATTLYPAVDLSGYLERARFPQFGLVPPPFNGRTFNIADIGLNFNYEFDFWGKNRQFLAASVSEQCAVQAEFAEAQLVVSTSVASTYFQLQNYMALRDIANTIVHLQQRLVHIVKARARHGIVSAIPITTAIYNLEIATTLAKQVEVRVASSHNQLAALAGLDPLNAHLPVQPFSARQVSLPHNLPANVLAGRPDVHAAKMRVEAAAHQVNVAKARFFPNFNLFALFSYQTVVTGRLFEPGSQNNAIGGAFDLPIFDAGLRRANLGVRYAEFDMAVNLYNSTLLTALREVGDQIASLKTLRGQITAQTQSLRATRHKYQLTLSRYKSGVDDYTAVLSLQTDLLRQQASLIALQARHHEATVAMIKALGGQV